MNQQEFCLRYQQSGQCQTCPNIRWQEIGSRQEPIKYYYCQLTDHRLEPGYNFQTITPRLRKEI
jgi:hypothetical protein